MNRLGLLAGLAALGALPAAAEEFKPQSSIETVTVYPLGASVTRHVPITLPAGSSAVVIDDLPGDLEADSVKVDGAADQAIEIGSVETRLAPADAEKDPKRQAILDEIQALNDRLAAANDKLGALDGRQKFIEKLIETTPAGFGRALGQSADGVERWSVAAETIGSELAAIADAARALHIEERTIQTGIDAKTKALAELPEPRAHTILTVALSAGAPATGALTVAYRVADARWVPTYDAMLTTGDKGGKPAVAIVRRAEVTQATGEDWSNVAMTLSTARPSGGTAAPQLEPSLASFVVDEVPYPAAASGALRDERAPAPMAKEMDAVSAPADRPVQILEAAADFGDFRAQYRVPGAVSVESGVGARGLRIATDDGGAELAVRAAPSLSDAAYLYAHFTASSGAPFLAGRVALFRDGSYIGSGAVPFSNAGKAIDLGFGPDDLVHVQRTALDRATGEHGVFSSRKTDTRRFKITVENLHKQKMNITVLDRMPYAEDDKIVVARLPEATAPTAENVEDRRGVLAWTYDYGPGESRDIENAYEVSWPADKSVVLAD